MEEKELELQTTFNEDDLDLLCDGDTVVENIDVEEIEGEEDNEEDEVIEEMVTEEEE